MNPHTRCILTLACYALAATHANAQQPDLAGAPLVAARQQAIDTRPFQRPVDAQAIRRWMEISSQCTMAEFELFLSPLTEEEREFVRMLETMAPPIVNRMHFEDIRAVFQRGQLSSYYVEQQLGSHLKHTTPALENELYGAYDCVFASIGPPDGTPRYGDVILRLKDSVRERGWATPFSGMHFIYTERHKDARKMHGLLAEGRKLSTLPTDPLSLGFDDRLHFSHYVVIERHWNRALAYQAILVLRNADKSPAGNKIRERFSTLLVERDAERFWATFIPAIEDRLSPEEQSAREPFGYLEAKFDGRLSLDFVTAIEVPPAKLAEVRAWPEARPYLHLIRAKPTDVP